MPNFASIHKKRFEKMESLDDHLNRKTERAKNLFGFTESTKLKSDNTNINNVAPNPHVINTKVEGYTRFGFKLNSLQKKKEQFKEEVQKKEPKHDLAQVRKKEREYIKGVRSNRRFDLLMQCRQSQL